MFLYEFYAGEIRAKFIWREMNANVDNPATTLMKYAAEKADGG